MQIADSVKALTDTLMFNDDVLNVSLTDLTDELARRRLRDGGPSIAWNIGHMLLHRNQIASAVLSDGPAFDLTRYSRDASDGHDYPTVLEFHRAWNDFSARFVSALRQLPPEKLLAPSPIRLPHGEQTLLDALRFAAWHETLHLGQVNMLRSHHGLTPTATLILTRMDATQSV